MGSEPRFEWPTTLDVPALVASGWSPLAFREFIIKIHSRCDLACDYCYMYEMADQSWRERPHKMTTELVEQVAGRIGEHARTHQIPDLALILHGGEPLLAGHELISRLVELTRKAVGPGTRVNVRVQTNAVGLDDSYLRLFRDLGVRIGVSVDGNAAAHDRHRRYASGRSSYSAVVAGLRRLTHPSFQHLFSGLLCTIDLRNDPIETYEALLGFDPPAIDFLLPHGTWAEPPPGRIPGAAETPYADWLVTVFDYWYSAPQVRIRLFEEIMHLILGGTSPAEMVGLSPARIVVIETDGTIEQGDFLKIAYHGAARTGLHLSRDSLDTALLLPGIVARQLGSRSLPPVCQECRIKRICGGGLYAHRYRLGSGFYNPSVYCPDLMRLIYHIYDRMRRDINLRLGGQSTE